MDNIYTILINEDHSFTHTNRKRIMQRSTGIDSIRFLVNPTYNDLDMTRVSTMLEIRTPVSHTYIPITLTPSEELYKNRVEFILPIDLKMTKEAGDLEMTIKFAYVSKYDDGTFEERVRTIGKTSLTIYDIVDWSDYIPSTDLDNIVQIMLTNKSILEEQRDLAEMIAYEKADGIAKDEETNEIYLTSNGVKLGTGVIDEDSCAADDGVPAVEFGSNESDVDDNPASDEFNNVAEFE